MTDTPDKPTFRAQPGPQSEFLKTSADIAIYGGSAGGGKALPLDAKILTPGGWVKNEDIKVGDYVVHQDGSPVKVLQIHNHESLKMYKISFQDGVSTVCCEDHLWQVQDIDQRSTGKYSVVSVKDILKRGIKSGRTYRYSIPLCNAAMHPQIVRYDDKPIDFYKIGEEIASTYKDTRTKYISPDLLTASVGQRMDLLSGILDNIGHVEIKGNHKRCRVTTFSPQLADDISTLIRSLGGIAKISKRKYKWKCSNSPVESYAYNITYRLPFNPFRSGDKYLTYDEYPWVNSLNRKIVDIKYLGTSPGKCITIDRADGLYVINDYIVTHNSYALLLDHLRHIKVPGYNGAFFRRTMKDIKNPGSLWDESTNIYPYFNGDPIAYKAQWKFPTKVKSQPAKISMLGLEYEKELENYKGSQIPVISFDELNTFEERMFWYMLSRNRSGNLNIKPYLRATTNPAPDSWLATLIDWWIGEDGFIIPERSGVIRYMVRHENETHWADTKEELVAKFKKMGEDVDPKSFTFIRSSIYDNQILMKNDPSYLANLKAQNKADRAALLDGNWKYKINRGMYFKEEWVTRISHIDEPMWVVQYWDRAGSEPTPEYPNPDYTAGVTMGIGRNTKNIYILKTCRFRERSAKVKQKIKAHAAEMQSIFGKIRICIERDAGAAGKDSAEDLAKHLSGFDVRIRKTGNKAKFDRFMPFSAAAENGYVYYLDGPWVPPYMSELESFTGLKQGTEKDDQVDATSGAYNEIVSYSKQDVSGITLSNLVLPSRFK